jgi:hypothetical protein
MFRHRMFVALCAALCTLAGFVVNANAFMIVSPTSLPLPNPLCPSSPANAIPNDNVDDYPAFDCAVKLVSAQGGLIYVGAGTYYLDAPLVIQDKHVAIRGEGQQISNIVWRQAGDGIRFTSTHQTLNYTLAVRSISLLKKTTSGGAAIRAQWVPPIGHRSRGIVTTVIYDVHIGMDTLAPAYWDFGIQLWNPTTATIGMFNIQGQSAGSGIAAIQIDANSVPDPVKPNVFHQKSIGVQILNGSIQRYVRGIEAKESTEGLHVQDVAIHEATWGIQVSHSVGTGLSNNYVLAREAGIELSETNDFAVTNNRIEQFDQVAFAGIRVSGGNRIRVIGNSIRSSIEASNHHGIVLQSNVKQSIVEANNTAAMFTGISVIGVPATPSVVTAEDNLLMANINRNVTVPCASGGAPISCTSGTSGVNNKFVHNH